MTIYTLEELYSRKTLVNYRKAKSLPKIPPGCLEAFEVRPDFEKPSIVYRFWDLGKAEDAFLFYYNSQRMPRVRLARIAVMLMRDNKFHKVNLQQLTFQDNAQYSIPEPEEQSHA